MVLALDILCLSLIDFFFMLLLFFHSFVLTLPIYSVESIKKKWQKFKQFKETKHKENQLKRAKKLETTSPTENVQFKGLVSFFPFSHSLSFLLSPSSSPLLYLLVAFYISFTLTYISSCFDPYLDTIYIQQEDTNMKEMIEQLVREETWTVGDEVGRVGERGKRGREKRKGEEWGESEEESEGETGDVD